MEEKVFSEILRRERVISASEIKKLGWIRSLRSAQERLDEAGEQSLAGASSLVACRAGCWYCCYYKVDVRAEDVFLIVDHVRSKFAPERAKKLREDVASNAKVMRRLSHQEQLAVNLKCPFLDEGKCSIYEVRPVRCRTFHATDVDGCKKSFEEPSNLDIQNSFVPELFTSNEAHVDGFRQALLESGYDSSTYELNSALALALTDSTPRRRFEKGKRAFPIVIAR